MGTKECPYRMTMSLPSERMCIEQRCMMWTVQRYEKAGLEAIMGCALTRMK